MLGDAGSKLLNLGLKGFLGGLKSGDVSVEKILLVLVELDAVVVVINPLGIEFFDLIPKNELMKVYLRLLRRETSLSTSAWSACWARDILAMEAKTAP